MKKSLFIFFLLLILLQGVSVVECFGAEKTVQVSLPKFNVQINGTVVNSKTAEYPLLVYKNITYMPMTYDYCHLLGLESSWTKEDGLTVSLSNSNTVPTVNEYASSHNNSSKMTATIVNTPITINGAKIDNVKEPYPFLRYKDVTYFPLTFKFTKETFNIYPIFVPDMGLGVYSENKFFYKYYPKGSKLQYTDLRVSSILYEMVAINISDGTGIYPANNVKEYDFWRLSAPLSPNYKDTKYYGYLPDENGGLRANVDSKVTPFGFITTQMNSIDDPSPVQADLNFAEYYSE
ncbi:hypothetical protein [Clostridium aminobutyricum]|uniref:Uncharacterized protein n=1 Tax=Clostridium aminobutyricum TaxID=33953 RepID=A0A939IJ13_CLOAM|nr:hypothetical protein [Clostridium aminobutyricum]MBN7773636.1 hypothetical protein [Clostridium aminobutyricum]